jgi:hypothetical protein
VPAAMRIPIECTREAWLRHCASTPGSPRQRYVISESCPVNALC